MSRVDDMEHDMELDVDLDIQERYESLKSDARALAAEVDELRAKLDDVRMGVGCARGQRTTQFCADLERTMKERDEYKRRLDALVKMLEVPSESAKPDGWLAYCENCWWRGEAEDAHWGTDPDSDGYCPSCGYEILEMGGDWSREKSIHARAVAIAEGRDK